MTRVSPSSMFRLGGLLMCVLVWPSISVGQEPPAGDPEDAIALAPPKLAIDPLAVASASLPAQNAPATQPAAEPEPEESVPYDILTTKRLTGDWFGARTDLEEVGFTFSPLLITVYQQNYRGGSNTHNAHEIAGKWFYNFELDFEKMQLLPGGSFFFRAVQTWNDGVRADVGSRVPPYWSAGSGGDFFIGDSACIIAEKWWYRQRFLDDRIELRLGKLLNVVDLFDVSAYGGNYANAFSNRALNHNLTIPTGLGLGAFLKVWPTDWLYFQTSAIDPDAKKTRTGFDTAFHGPARFIGNWEFGLTPKWKTEKGTLPGAYKFGWWYNPRTLTVFKDTLGGALSDDFETGDVGFYVTLDQLIYKENDDPTDKQGLGMFLRYGYAHGDVNQLEHFWSAGTQYRGLIPERDNDLLGFGVAQSILSKQYRAEIDSRANRETVYELYYALQVTPWCVITPDIQVITDPGGWSDARDALVGGVRIKIAF